MTRPARLTDWFDDDGWTRLANAVADEPYDGPLPDVPDPTPSEERDMDRAYERAMTRAGLM